MTCLINSHLSRAHNKRRQSDPVPLVPRYTGPLRRALGDMSMDGTYHIGAEHIRALALQCHALDIQFDPLFNNSSICGYSENIYRTYNRLLSTNLLNLAIAIRVGLSTEPGYTSRTNGVSNCGLFDGTGPHGDGSFSIKDVCDKLIHADRITKPIETGAKGSCCELAGSYHGEQWDFGLGVRIFTEYVLKWLDELEGNNNA